MKKRLIAFLTVFTVLAGTCCLPTVVSASTVEGDIILVDEDFSTGFELDRAYTAAEMEALSEDLNFATGVPANHWPDKTNAYFKVKQIDANDASKGNYLEISSQKDDSHAIVMGDFADITTGAFVVEMKMRPQAGRRTKLYNGVVGTDQSVKYTLYGVNSSDAVVWSYGIFPSWQKQLTPGEDDFCSVKTVWSRANAASNWSVDMYDMVTNKLLLSYTTGGENTLDSSFVPSAVMFYNNWQVAADSEVSVDIADLKVYIPAEVTLSESTPYDSMEKVISYTVSEDIDENSLTAGSVKVTGPSGQDVAVNPSWNAASMELVLSFPYGLPVNGDYTVDFSGIRTARGFAVNKTATFAGEKTVMPLKIASVTPNEGEIPNTIPSIQIVFSQEIDPSTASAITFTKADGRPVAGFSETTVDGKTVTISFGTLTPGDYVLTIGTGVATKEDGEFLESEGIYTFTAVETIDLFEDYSSDEYETGEEYTGVGLNGKVAGLVYKNEGTYTVEEVNGDKFITMRPTAVNSGPGLSVELDDPLTVGTFELDVRMKRSGGNMFTNMFGVNDSANKNAMTVVATAGGTKLDYSSDKSKVGGVIAGNPSVDENEFMSLKITVSRSTLQDAWDFRVVDKLNESDVYTAEIGTDKLLDVKKFSLVSVYTLKESELTESISVSELSVKVSRFAKVLSSDCDGILPTTETVNLLLNGDIEAENLKAFVVDKNNEDVVISTKAEYFPDERRLQLDFNSYLDFGADYVIRFENAEISEYEFSTADAPLLVTAETLSYLDNSNGVITTLPDEGTYKAAYDVTLSNPQRDNKEILLILISYQPDGKINKVTTKTINSSNAQIDDTITQEELTKASANELKCFIWEKTTTGYLPVAK